VYTHFKSSLVCILILMSTSICTMDKKLSLATFMSDSFINNDGNLTNLWRITHADQSYQEASETFLPDHSCRYLYHSTINNLMTSADGEEALTHLQRLRRNVKAHQKKQTEEDEFADFVMVENDVE